MSDHIRWTVPIKGIEALEHRMKTGKYYYAIAIGTEYIWAKNPRGVVYVATTVHAMIETEWFNREVLKLKETKARKIPRSKSLLSDNDDYDLPLGSLKRAHLPEMNQWLSKRPRHRLQSVVRFMVNERHGFYMKKSDPLIIHPVESGWKLWEKPTAKTVLGVKYTALGHRMNTSPVAKSLFLEEFGFSPEHDEVFKRVYPNSCMREQELKAQRISPLTKVFLMHRSAKDAVRELTGYSGKELTKTLLALATKDNNVQLKLITAAKRHRIPEDKMQRLVKSPGFLFSSVKSPYRFIKVVGIDKFLNWLDSVVAHQHHILNDTIRMWYDLRGPEADKILRSGNLKWAHDSLTILWRAKESEKVLKELDSDVAPKVLKKHMKLHMQEQDNIKLSIPSNRDIVNWGKQYEHCIGSYVKQHHEGRTILFGVHVDGQLVYQGQCSPLFTLIQLHGMRNCEAPADIHQKVEAILKRARGGYDRAGYSRPLDEDDLGYPQHEEIE